MVNVFPKKNYKKYDSCNHPKRKDDFRKDNHTSKSDILGSAGSGRSYMISPDGHSCRTYPYDRRGHGSAYFYGARDPQIQPHILWPIFPSFLFLISLTSKKNLPMLPLIADSMQGLKAP